MVFEYDYEKTVASISTTFEKTKLDMKGLDKFSGKDFQYTIEYPVGGTNGNIKWDRYQFSLTKFPSEVNSSLNEIREWVALLCKAMMTLLFVRHVYALLWRF